MEEYTDVRLQIKALLTTGLEGLQHVNQQILTGNYAETAPLLETIFAAVSSINYSIKQISQQRLLMDRLESLSNILQHGFSLLVKLYEQQLWTDAARVITDVILPAYMAWMAEVNTIVSEDKPIQRRCQLLLRQ